MIDISKYKVIPRKGLSCYESCVLSAAEYYRGNCSMAFCETFQFQYNKNVNKIGDRISFNCNIIKRIQSLYSVTLSSFEYELNKDYLSNLFNKKNKIYLVSTSVYHCNWMKEYQRVDRAHCLMALSVKNNEVLFSDPMVSADLIYINFEELFKMLNPRKNLMYVLDCSLPISTDKQNEIKYSFQQILQSSNEAFDDFITDIKNLDDLHLEYEGIEYSYWSSSLDTNIGYFLSGTRTLYSEFLNDMSNILRNKQLSAISIEVVKLKDKWEVLRNLLLRCHITKTFIKEKNNIIDRITDIKIQEYNLKNSIKNIEIL